MPTILFSQDLKKNNIEALEEAKKLSWEMKFDESLAVLDRSFLLQQAPLKAPNVVLELAAFNFEKLRSYKAAITHLYIIVNRNYQESHKEISLLYQNKKTEEFNQKRINFSDNQTRLYFQIAQLYSHILNDNLYTLPQEEINDAQEKGLFYYRLSFLKYSDEAMKGIRQIEEIEQDKKNRKYKSHWYIPTSLFLWQDTVKASQGSTEEYVEGSAKALAAGIAYRLKNTHQGFHLELQAFYGSGDLSKGNATTRYQSGGNALIGSMLSPGFTGYAVVRNLVFGIEFPLFFKKGNYQNPSNGVAITDESFITPGILGLLSFTGKKIDLVFKLGRFLHFNGPFLSLGLNFNL